jgi:transcriptional regulator with GAF, ATPase, and Fis domain
VSTDITESKRVEQELGELRRRLQAESDYLKEETQVRSHSHGILGHSSKIKKLFQRMEQVSPTDSIVLITGETGSGKELVARSIHGMSLRKDRVMVKVDCSSLPPSLIEAELFGREKGAYTGALTKQIGRFELANGSTLFLDEIGELPLELQAKLLRIVQDGEFERLGNPRTIRIDVRVIAATNRDLAKMMRNAAFREDLFYRLNVFPIHVPPLRERTEDIPPLASTFIKELERKAGKRIDSLSPENIRLLQAYSWPGNVRELRNVIEQAVILSKGGPLDLQIPQPLGAIPLTTLRQAECQHILAALEKTGWQVKGTNGAAELLGLNPSTLFSAMHRLGIPTKSHKV